jgi:hypothetical protein
VAEHAPTSFVTRDELRGLIAERPGPAVSIYLPTHRARPAAEGDLVTLKNLVRQAEEGLAEHGLRKPDARRLLDSVIRLVDDKDFWRGRLDGLAIFSAPEFFRFYRLPFEVAERVVVADSLHTKPLLPALATEGHFYVLAISQGSVRLLRGTRLGADEVPLDDLDVPRNLEDELRFDHFEAQLQHHAPSAGRAPGGRNPFHGHGADTDDQKTQILRYFQHVDQGLSKLLGGEHAPLVLAAVDYLHPLYRRASSYRHITRRGIEGNPDQLSGKQLHERAWPIVEPHFQASMREARDKFSNLEGSPRASTDLEDVLAAGESGRVESLLLAEAKERWGIYDPQDGSVVYYDGSDPGSVDLLDLAARQTIAHGGNVYVMDPSDMPGGADVAAVYRF